MIITYKWNQGDRFLDEFPDFIQKPVPVILILKCHTDLTDFAIPKEYPIDG